MTPDQLTEQSFALYPPMAKAFAAENLPLLRQLPLSVCPSFLDQIRALDTMFPRERLTLRQQCQILRDMSAGQRDALLKPLREIALPDDLALMDWVNQPAAFVERLTAVLWSSGQINAFHTASRELFAALPVPEQPGQKLLLVVVGQGADTARPSLLKKLARQGLRLEALNKDTAQQELLQLLVAESAKNPEPYAHWYVDGGNGWTLPPDATAVQSISYQRLQPLRKNVLRQMQNLLDSSQSGAELMRTRLAAATPQSLGAAQVAADPVLQRFYTELFTASSGPQIFSTSFVQWTGRELLRRAQPSTLLLRYTPRQRHRGLNEMVDSPDEHSLDPEGALVDAEMGAFYNWIEMNRTAAAGNLTTLAWAEGSSRAVLIGPGTRPNTLSHQPLTVTQAIRAVRNVRTSA